MGQGYGVVIGRFQVSQLHKGHRLLLDEVQAKHERLVVLIGVNPLGATHRDPLSFETRSKMVSEDYPNSLILALPNRRTDALWSESVDQILENALGIQAKPVLYGGRDSFIPFYSGHFPTKIVLSDFEMSATAERKLIGERVQDQKSFRDGVIWAVENQYPAPVPTVDIAVFNSDYTKILLAQKPGESAYRFFGGFCLPESKTYEMDARREVREEAGIEITDPEYICNKMIDDWRYRNQRNQVHTTLFGCTHMFGKVEAGDDVALIQWFDMSSNRVVFVNLFMEEHRGLAAIVWNWRQEKVFPLKGDHHA